MAPKRILILATSHDKLTTGEPTGLWAEELVVPYYTFKDAGAEVVIASVKGGKIPIDAGSLSEGAITEHVKKFLGNASSKALLEDTPSVHDIKGSFDAVFIPGGHGPMFDVASDKDTISLLEKFWAEGKVIGAVCHGPGGIVNVKTPGGEHIVKGKKVTGFTNSEEESVGKTKKVPFLLETTLIELGGHFERSPDWQPHAVADGKLVTGQNPASSSKVAHLILEAVA
eukprot:TRINITY_DN18998_c0_g1_i1.p1 TRINITY_DN18998_c0_g1~~TRINITY_DN18998_c0_g1_i1.p1  ORF type:complete len:227 (+),score=43.90 TRINITY_DN18998_c0_g1_i1:130-810(+)